MADKKKTRGQSALGGKKKAKSKSSKGRAKKPHKMTLRRAHDGSYIIEHHHKATDKEAPEVDEHTAPDMDGLLSHIKDHMAGPEEEEEQEPAHGAPSMGGGAMMGGM